jgi:L-ascorbate metabolism protein UlaG (beta-lactamase superfamily)
MELVFNWIGGASFIVSIGNLMIACDPVLCKKGTIQDFFWFKSERIEEPVYDNQTFKNIDLWLITHNHEDHIDEIGLSKIDNPSKVICNRNTLKKLSDKGITDLTVLDWHQSKKVSIKGYEIEIEAIPAIHGVNPLSAFFAGQVNGYFLTISNGKEKVRVYLTGDTVYKNKVISSLANKEIDLLIPNMGAAKQGSWVMTLTLNSKMLKKMLTRIHPQVVIPVHYGTFCHYIEPAQMIKEIDDKRIRIVEVGSKTKLEINGSHLEL